MFFVSYSRHDTSFAVRLARDLRGAGVTVWIDQDDIPPGSIWDREVERALREATGVLVILSPNAVASNSVMDEVSFALDEGKKVVPALYQPSQIPFRLRRLQYTDFTSDYSAAIGKLARALGGQTQAYGQTGRDNNPAQEQFLSSRKAQVSRRTRLMAAIWVGLAGGVFSAVAIFLIYVNDQRVRMGMVNPPSIALIGGAVAAVLWWVAGVIAGPRRVPFWSMIAASLITLNTWVLVGGTYQDVLSAAVGFGAPIGGIIGASVGSSLTRARRQ